LSHAAIPDIVAPIRAEGLRRRVATVLEGRRKRAPGLDEDTSFPVEDIASLAEAGALLASLPFAYGGLGFGTESKDTSGLVELLRQIGHASLPLGPLYEGHVNALALVIRCGTPRQIGAMSADVLRGRLFGVWNTEDGKGLRLVRRGPRLTLQGRKTFASGTGHLSCALVTARDERDGLLMLLVPVEEFGAARVDLSAWRAHGMRASATGSVDFSGIEIEESQIIGGDDDYHRQPLFSGGAWRFAAVQLGALERLVEETCIHLRKAGRTEDPYQKMRMGQAAIAAESARLWVGEAAPRAETAAWGDGDADAAVAYVNLARSAVERASLEVLEIAQRSIGLAAFSRLHPIEKLMRDLATYLRQPAPDRALAEGAGYVLASETPFSELWPWA
jgi:alkylation response protein AidB-like acyl-CoA dehydrogenase